MMIKDLPHIYHDRVVVHHSFEFAQGHLLKRIMGNSYDDSINTMNTPGAAYSFNGKFFLNAVQQGTKIILLEGKNLSDLDQLVPAGKKIAIISINLLGGG